MKHPNTSWGALLLAVCLAPSAHSATATLYYYLPYKAWATADIHHNATGAWTTAPGNPMNPACDGWVSKQVDLGSASRFEAVFNNATTSAWDNPIGGGNYTVTPGTHQVRNGRLIANAGTPCVQAASASSHLGAVYAEAKTGFSIWSPDSGNVALSLEGIRYPMARVADANGYSAVYAVEVTGDQHLKRYHFEIDGRAVRDPYGVMVSPETDDNIVIDPRRTALAGGWSARPALLAREDAVIYETHVRDFTIDASSGVAADKRGKYLGLVQSGTTVNAVAGAPKTGIDHLVDLGVTHVQLMPLQDFGSCSPSAVRSNPDCYNWGYDPVNYSVPEERYSAAPNDPVARIKEFKTMVDEFHKRGLRVVMDVVYNHSNAKDMFAGITPKYYTATDLSATGNSIDTKQAMVARMIRDSLEHWVREYNVDGFRFDLMGVFDYAAVGEWGRYLNAQFPDRTLLLYGEPWNAGIFDDAEATRVRAGTIGAIADAHVGMFNGFYRDALKGSGDDGNAGGFVFNQGAAGTGIADGIKASSRLAEGTSPLPDLWDHHFTADPEQTINHVDVHDNLCLADKVDAWAQANGWASAAGYKQRIQEFALSAVLTSQGIPFLHGGSEMRRTKQGDKNSYQSPDSVNKYDWNWRLAHAATYEFVRKVIGLRKAHPSFRMKTWSDIKNHVNSEQRSSSLVVTQIDGAANADGWTTALVIANSGGGEVITLPAGNWKVALERSSADAGGDRVVSGTFTAEGTAVSVLYR
jgi:pullulanase